MKNISWLLILIVISQSMIGQEDHYQEKELTLNEFTTGTYTTPQGEDAHELIIFIQGSGPTDRNGNQPMLQNDGIKKIARALAKNKIASFRYDKRIFKMQQLNLKEEDLVFEDFIKDVNEIVSYFRIEKDFKKIIIAGHSEGSLIGMVAAQKDADAFISLAGPADPIDEIIIAQLSNMAPQMGDSARTAFDELEKNGEVNNYSPMLETVFRPSVQPYMLSWMKFDPTSEISKLEIPVLIVNGTADIQVSETQAEKLAMASENSELVIMDQMNHIFRKMENKDRLMNTKSYNEPNLPLHPELITTLTQFVKELD